MENEEVFERLMNYDEDILSLKFERWSWTILVFKFYS